MEIVQSKSTGTLLTISIVTSMILFLFFLDYAVFRADLKIVDVVREMVIIPCVLAQPVLLILALRHLKRPFCSNIMWSVLLNVLTLIGVGLGFI